MSTKINRLTPISSSDSREINGGATIYDCPFGCNKSGGYWSVYAHCLLSGCFTRNKYLNACWNGARWCFEKAFDIEFGKLMKKGKHAK